MAALKSWVTVLILTILSWLGPLPASALAEQSVSFGDYVVHYNAFNSSILAPEMARTYGINRSKFRGLMNVSVLKKVMGTTGQPVSATVSGTAANLSKQLRELSFREVHDRTAIYYMADFTVTDGETLDFMLEVTPAGSGKTQTISFRQQFFTE